MPCTANRLPSVTISDGTAVRITMIAVDQPDDHAKRQRHRDAQPDRQAVVARDDGHGHRAKRHHGADRNVQFARDHQQADGNGDDAKVGGDVQPAGHARRFQKGHAAEDAEEDQDGEQAQEGPGLGAAQQAAE